ncbi:hypothetical protein Taro_033540, partial [Colocasia esculenta]|nr:hypothetical protein [Colocasia esculenta]
MRCRCRHRPRLHYRLDYRLRLRLPFLFPRSMDMVVRPSWRGLRMALPSFKGESQLLLVESWLREVDKIFRAIRCAEEDKVRLATYMLQVLRV